MKNLALPDWFNSFLSMGKLPKIDKMVRSEESQIGRGVYSAGCWCWCPQALRASAPMPGWFLKVFKSSLRFFKVSWRFLKVSWRFLKVNSKQRWYMLVSSQHWNKHFFWSSAVSRSVLIRRVYTGKKMLLTITMMKPPPCTHVGDGVDPYPKDKDPQPLNATCLQEKIT